MTTAPLPTNTLTLIEFQGEALEQFLDEMEHGGTVGFGRGRLRLALEQDADRREVALKAAWGSETWTLPLCYPEATVQALYDLDPEPEPDADIPLNCGCIVNPVTRDMIAPCTTHSAPPF